LAGIDGDLDPTLKSIPDDLPCQKCRKQDDESTMLLCDGCNDGWHMSCLPVPLMRVPDGDWICPKCLEAGLTLEQLQTRADFDKSDSHLYPTAAQKRVDKQAREYHGRLLRKKSDGTVLWGRVCFTDPKNRPKYFLIKWSDGTRVEATLADVLDGKQHELLVAGKKLPKHVVISATWHSVVAVTHLTLDQLPDKWDLSDPKQLSAAFDLLMPGDRGANVVTRLSRGVAAQQQGVLMNVPTYLDEVTALLQAVDFSTVSTVVDPFSGTGIIARVLTELGLTVSTNDLDPVWKAQQQLDALQPVFWKQHVGVDCVVSSPHFALLDLIVPLAIRTARKAVCLHVPGHYLANPTPMRQQFLHELGLQDRLVVLFGLPRGPMGRRCAWLLVFTDRQQRHA
jgi:hypothetical protein